MKRRVFFISDRTGITAETLGASLLTQFPDIEFLRHHIPFVTNELAARAALANIARRTADDSEPPLVFSTLTDPAVQRIVAASSPFVFDLFGTFIEPLEAALGCASSHTAGRMHGIGDSSAYERRVSALNYTLGHDDGLSPRDLDEADLVLVGVSRCGKTPTCLYLAMHYSLRAANYPLTDDDFENNVLPRILRPCRDKLYGLTIVPEQLSRIRRERRPHGDYSTLARCRAEVHQAEALFRTENIPFLDTTTVSIEEIAATIVRDMGLH
ncbi:MAG: pyruvate, water dikinase regulatory protein [Gammaproteobacteria bacterium]